MFFFGSGNLIKRKLGGNHFIPVYYEGHNVREDYLPHIMVPIRRLWGEFCNEKEEATNVVNKIIAMEDPEKADYPTGETEHCL